MVYLKEALRCFIFFFAKLVKCGIKWMSVNAKENKGCFLSFKV